MKYTEFERIAAPGLRVRHLPRAGLLAAVPGARRPAVGDLAVRRGRAPAAPETLPAKEVLETCKRNKKKVLWNKTKKIWKRRN